MEWNGTRIDSTFVVVSVLDHHSLPGRPRAVLLISCLCMCTQIATGLSPGPQRMFYEAQEEDMEDT